MSAPAPPLRRVTAHARLELRLLLRSGESLLVTFGVPLGLLLFFGTTDVLPTPTEDPLDFLVPGVLAIAILSTGFVAQAIQTGFERKYGVLKRLGASPLTRGQFVTGKAVAVAAVVAVQVVVLLAIARFLGWTPGLASSSDEAALSLVECETLLGCSGQPVPWLVPVGVLLGAAVFTALGLTIAGALRPELVLAGSNALYLLMLALTGLVFELPAAAAPVVALTPSGALGTVLRQGLTGTTETSAVAALVVLLAWGAATVVVARRTFRWEP